MIEEIEKIISDNTKYLELLHGEQFVLVYDNYFLSPSGILYSFFRDKLKFINPSYKYNRNGKKRPTLRINFNKKRLIFLQYRLTAQFFSPEDIRGKIVNHKDGDVYNVHPSNLDIGDHSNNMLHSSFMNTLYKNIDQQSCS